MTEKRTKLNGEEYHPSENELFEANRSRHTFEERFRKLFKGTTELPLETTEIALGMAARIIKEMDRTCLEFKDLVLESYLDKAVKAQQNNNLEAFYELVSNIRDALSEFQFLHSQHPGSWDIYNCKVIDLLSGVENLDVAKIANVYENYIRQLGWNVKDLENTSVRKNYARACGEYALFLAFYMPEKMKTAIHYVDQSNRYGRSPYGGVDSILTCTAFAEALIALEKTHYLEALKKIEVGFGRFEHLHSDKRAWLRFVLPTFAKHYLDIASDMETKEQVSSLRLSSLDEVVRNEPEVSELLLAMMLKRFEVVERICGIASYEFLTAAIAVAHLYKSRNDFKSAFKMLRRTRQSRRAQPGVERVLALHHVGLTYAMMFRRTRQKRREQWAWRYAESLTEGCKDTKE